MNAIHKSRLLKCARIVEKAKSYDQSLYDIKDNCGCALSHYDYVVLRQTGPETHFGLSRDEYYEIFGVRGCGEAKTGKQAAAYIQKFIERKAV